MNDNSQQINIFFNLDDNEVKLYNQIKITCINDIFRYISKG